MPRRINRRKAIQAAKRKALATDELRKNKKSPSTRRVGLIAHHNGSSAALLSLLMGANAMGKDALK